MTPQTISTAATNPINKKMLRLAVIATVAAIAAIGVISAHAQDFNSDQSPLLASATSPAAFTNVARESTPFSTSASSTLPEAPSSLVALQDKPLNASVPASTMRTGAMAPKYEKYIPAGMTAQPLTAHDKIVLGFRDAVSPFSFLGIIASAGYSHALNGQPNYGTDRGAFGQRLGATAIRDTSEQLFTDTIFAPALHQDPRYYVLGDGHGFIHRVIYSVTRPLITRTDSGHNTVNTSLMLGYASGSALSYTYYPAINQNFHDTAATFGGSLAGAAVGDFVSEFTDSALVLLHLKHSR